MPEYNGAYSADAKTAPKVFLAFALGALGVLLARCAWLGPDVYAIFGAIAKIESGQGLTPEDPGYLQALAHPLWLFVLYAQHALVKETYLAPLLVCWLLTMSAAFFLLLKISRTNALAWVAAAAVLASHAFVDYATSGLETPLLYFLISLFLMAYMAENGNTFTVFAASLLASFLMLTRMDTAVLLFPALLFLLLGKRSAANAFALLIGLCPLVSYLIYALAVMGLSFNALLYPAYDNPNSNATALQQGAAYFANSILHDPITLFTVLAGLSVCLFRRNAKELVLAAGVFIYILFTLCTGADAYSGRLFAAPFFMGLALLTRLEVKDITWKWTPLMAAILTASLLMPDPNLLSAEKYGKDAKSNTDPFGIKNERRTWHKKTGLLQYNRRVPTPRFADFKQTTPEPKARQRTVAPQKKKPQIKTPRQSGAQKKSLKQKSPRPKRIPGKK